MRSRYCAYVLSDIDYIMETHDPSTAMNADRAGAARWAKDAEFRGLEILSVEGGEVDDDEGMVEFKARYVRDGASCLHHERSTFRKSRGRWFYVDGEMGKPTHGVRSGPKVGRNDPCPCGSGKKYKKCCGV
jgi:SEC-C motif domain protein